ncbi:MAG TPA: 50S ribosomal protein L6 [Steroidobacteraceae bacterium]|nr:50S ribosomal protein L6 [Steroidobacteraceae bacterium]
MSRVAKKPVALPKGVECNVAKDTITIKGPKGTLKLAQPAGVEVGVQGAVVQFKSQNASTKLAGTARALIANMVKGVSEGYQRKLELVGVGYRAALQGKDLNLTLGFSHPIVFKAPEGITITVPSQTEILIAGADKQRVGEVAAKIRAFRPPEPYKGKGVRYSDEKITLKEAKKA